MSKAHDLTGKRFGRLVAIQKEKPINGRGMWLCKCDCGNEKIIASANLIHCRTQSCGCINKKEDISGKKYGELTVISFDGYYKLNPKWKCECSCGAIVSLFENGLKTGKTVNCGDKGKHSKYKGMRFGRLTVQDKTTIIDGKMKYLCKCDCGNEKYVSIGNLTSGNTKSCGCIAKEKVKPKKEPVRRLFQLKFLSKDDRIKYKRLYNIWSKMIGRCERPYESSYERYGGKGISVCQEWHLYENFFYWALENGYNDTLTIDRIDNAGNYEPSNCRWATYKQQANNTSANVFVEFNGERKTLAELAEEYKIPYKTFHERYRTRKWDLERALTTPLRKSGAK